MISFLKTCQTVIRSLLAMVSIARLRLRRYSRRSNSFFHIPAGQIWRAYYYANSQRVAYRESTSGGSTLYDLFSDHLGSTLLVTDASLNPVTTLRYSDFGIIRYSAGATAGPNAFTYTGQRQASLVGLDFYNSGWYDSALGRFTQPDTVIPDGKNPGAYDRFAYVMNDPILLNDPTGHDVGCAGSDADNCGNNGAPKDRSGYTQVESKTATVNTPRFDSNTDSYDKGPSGNDVNSPIVSAWTSIVDFLAAGAPPITSNIDVNLYSQKSGTNVTFPGFSVTNESSANVFLYKVDITSANTGQFPTSTVVNHTSYDNPPYTFIKPGQSNYFQIKDPNQFNLKKQTVQIQIVVDR